MNPIVQELLERAAATLDSTAQFLPEDVEDFDPDEPIEATYEEIDAAIPTFAKVGGFALWNEVLEALADVRRWEELARRVEGAMGAPMDQQQLLDAIVNASMMVGAQLAIRGEEARAFERLFEELS